VTTPWAKYLRKCGLLLAGEGGLFLFKGTQADSGFHPVSYSVGTKGSFPGGYGSGGVMLTNHPHLVLMLKMSGAIMYTSPHACVADTGTVLTFTWFCQVR